MAFHMIAGGAATASAAAGAGMLATANTVSHDTWVLLIPAAISSIAAIGGFAVAALSYWKHRKDESAAVARADQLEAELQARASAIEAELQARTVETREHADSNLERHQEHDDRRFDRLERLFLGLPPE